MEFILLLGVCVVAFFLGAITSALFNIHEQLIRKAKATEAVAKKLDDIEVEIGAIRIKLDKFKGK